MLRRHHNDTLYGDRGTTGYRITYFKEPKKYKAMENRWIECVGRKNLEINGINLETLPTETQAYIRHWNFAGNLSLSEEETLKVIDTFKLTLSLEEQEVFEEILKGKEGVNPKIQELETLIKNRLTLGKRIPNFIPETHRETVRNAFNCRNFIGIIILSFIAMQIFTSINK